MLCESVAFRRGECARGRREHRHGAVCLFVSLLILLNTPVLFGTHVLLSFVHALPHNTVMSVMRVDARTDNHVLADSVEPVRA